MRHTMRGQGPFRVGTRLEQNFYRWVYTLIGPVAGNSIGFDAGCQKVRRFVTAVPR